MSTKDFETGVATGNISKESPLAQIDAQISDLRAQQEETAAAIVRGERLQRKIQTKLDVSKGQISQSAQQILGLVNTVGSAACLRAIAMLAQDLANKASLGANAIADDTEALNQLNATTRR